MTVATYGTNLVEIVGDTQTTSNTNWTALGGGPQALNPGSTELFIEGSEAMTKDGWGQNRRGMMYDTLSDQGGSGTDGAYSFWVTFTAVPSLDTKAGGGLDVLIGSSTSAYEHYHVAGSDTVPFGGWLFAAINEGTAGDETTGTPTGGVEQTFGVLADAIAVGSPTKGETIALDTVREGRHDVVIEFGTGADPEATFDGIITNLETSTLRWGLLAQREPGGAFESSGLIQFGTGSNACEFLDRDKVIFLRDHDHVTSNFHTWEANNASSIITFTNLVVKALGATSAGRWITNDDATLLWTTCQFIDMGTFLFDSNSTIDTCTFLGCGQITHDEATMNGSTISGYTGAANTSALVYNINADPDGEMDDMKFVANSGTLSHAIEFGTSIPTDSITLRGCDFTGYSASQDVNDSIFHFLDTTGTITLNLVGCTSDVAFATSFRTEGVVVTVVEDPITATFKVLDNDLADLENARVLVEASDGTGDLLFQASTTSLTQSGGTATCDTTAAHGLTTGDEIVMRGANEAGYNLTAVVTVSDTDTFTYAVNSGLASPATGTPVVTGVVVDGDTDVNGEISDARTWTQPQPISGTARASSGSPFFKAGRITGTISNTADFNSTTVMVLDE